MATLASVPLRNTRSLSYVIRSAPFVLAHVALVGLYWTGLPRWPLVTGIALYWIRMFAVTGGYHRYFSHRTFKTGRVFQFILAFLAETSMQKGILWWASHHRVHHKLSDQPGDVHSPVQRGFWYSHVGWLFDPRNDATHMNLVRDLAKYPELRWLNKYWVVPPAIGSVVLGLTMGWAGFLVGGVLSTVALWHGTFTINSFSHIFGRRRFQTTDDSRNNALLAVITMGEGWHNNHHHYMLSTRQGFRWWEIDVTYYVLRALAAVGVVWDLREPPRELMIDAPAATVEKQPAAQPALVDAARPAAVDLAS